MLIGNKLYKHDDEGNIVRLTTDDLVEGEYHKFNLDYPDGKRIGDVIVRYSSEDIPAHHRITRLPGENPSNRQDELHNYTVYQYEAPEFYAYCLERKNAAMDDADDPNYNFARTEEEYLNYLETHGTTTTLDGEILHQPYCPYFVLHYASMDVYQVKHAITEEVGYSPITGSVGTAVTEDYIYTDNTLMEVKTIDLTDWRYTEVIETISMNYVHLPSLPSYAVANSKSYYYVVTHSRVVDEKTSIRTVNVSNTVTLSSDKQAYVKNLGNQRNLDLEFGIPSGVTPSISIGEVRSGINPTVTTSGTERDVIFNFTFPKGDKGDAGGVIVLNYIGETAPATATINQLFFNTTNNKIYIYGTSWEEYLPAVTDMIYLHYNVCYYFDGTQLQKTYAEIQVNPDSTRFYEGQLEVHGVRSKKHIGDDYTAPDVLRCDWVGTEAEWDYGRANGLIPDEYICYITDD